MTIKYSIEAGVSAAAFVVTLGKAGAKMGGTGGAAVLVAEVDVATAGVSLLATGINVLLATQAGDQYNQDKQKLEGAGKSKWEKISKELKDKEIDVSSWNKGHLDCAQDSLAKHFVKHGKEVGATSAEQYLRKNRRL